MNEFLDFLGAVLPDQGSKATQGGGVELLMVCSDKTPEIGDIVLFFGSSD